MTRAMAGSRVQHHAVDEIGPGRLQLQRDRHARRDTGNHGRCSVEAAEPTPVAARHAKLETLGLG